MPEVLADKPPVWPGYPAQAGMPVTAASAWP